MQLNSRQPTQPPAKRNNWLIIGGIFVGLCVICLVIGLISSAFRAPTPQPTTDVNSIIYATQTSAALTNGEPMGLAAQVPPTATLMPTPTPQPQLGMDLSQFVAKYDSLTDLQKKDFVSQSTGKWVDWSGTILDVQTDGTILVDIPETLASSVSLKGVPLTDAGNLSKGATIRFTGRIADIVDILGLHIYLEDVQLVVSTATFTPTVNTNLLEPGTYLVGKDIKPGLYKGQAGTDTCYWARLKDVSGTVDLIIANDNSSGQFYILVKDSDYALQTACELLLFTTLPTPAAQMPTNLAAGMYLVGIDIQPGKYQGQAGTDTCYWARLKDVSGTVDLIIANDNSSGQFYIQVSKSDFALTVACPIVLIGK